MRGRVVQVARFLVRGLVAGLAGTLAMSAFQSAWNRSSNRRRHGGSSTDEKEPTDIVACTTIVERMASLYAFTIPARLQRRYGVIMHYAFGASAGVMYGFARKGVLRELPFGSRTGAGALLGLTMFFGADEIVTPMLGLKRGSLMGSRAYGVTSHLVYGAVLAAVYEQAKELL
jgi:hypothetical protein